MKDTMINKVVLEQGINNWQAVAETLNSIILARGHIDINNEEIWQGILHKWSNEDWVYAITAVAKFYEQHPEYFKSFHRDAYSNAISTLRKYLDVHERVMDKRVNKKTAWKMIMTMRELWNAVNEINLPNDYNSKKRNEFKELFDV